MSIEERLSRLEQAFITLTELAVRADERMDAHDRNFDEVDRKLAALVDAQIKTEESLNRLEAQMARTDEQMARTEAQMARTDERLAQTDERLNRLADTVERHIVEGHNRQS